MFKYLNNLAPNFEPTSWGSVSEFHGFITDSHFTGRTRFFPTPYIKFGPAEDVMSMLSMDDSDEENDFEGFSPITSRPSSPKKMVSTFIKF